MGGEQAEVTGLLLAKGLTEFFDQIVGNGCVIQQDASMPSVARRALTLVSLLALDAGTADIGASIHDVMDKACEPLRDWGLPQFSPPFRYADVVLIDRDLGVPTDDCREMAREAGSEAAIQEEIHHEQLRAALQSYSAKTRNAAYTAIREFVVRNPLVTDANLHRFVTDGGHAAVAKTIFSFYRNVPQVALFAGTARHCGHCGSLIWPDRDSASFPDGRCRIRQCRLAHPTTSIRDEIGNPSAWRLGTNAVLGYWVGPGLDEIRIYDALKAAGRNVVLYPMADAADVGIDGMSVGIDVKTYASPVVLASKLTHSIGRLSLFARRIVAFPDDKLRLNRDYGNQLRETYRGEPTLEFMTVSEVIREFSR